MITKDYQLNYYDILTYADKIINIDVDFIKTCVEKLPNWKSIVVKRHIDRINACQLHDWNITAAAKYFDIGQGCMLNILCKIQAEFEMYLYLNGNVYFRDGFELNINDNIKSYGEEENKNKLKIDVRKIEKLSKTTLLEYLGNVRRQIRNNILNNTSNNIPQKQSNVSNLNKSLDKIISINQEVTKKDIIKENIIKENIIKESNIKQDIIKQDINKVDTIKEIIKENNIKDEIIKEDVKQEINKENIIKKDIKKNNTKIFSKKDIIKEDPITNKPIIQSPREKNLIEILNILKTVSNLEDIFGETQTTYIKELFAGKTIKEISISHNKNYQYLLNNICGAANYRRRSEMGITLLFEAAKKENKVRYKNAI